MPNNNQSEEVERLLQDFESRYSYLYQGTVYENGGGNFSPVHESVKHWLRQTLTTHGASEYARGKREALKVIENMTVENANPQYMINQNVLDFAGNLLDEFKKKAVQALSQENTLKE